MPMVPDPMRAVCGEPCGNQILEEFLRSRLKVCVITTKHNPDILSKDEVKWMSSLGIEIETLQCPANWKDGFSASGELRFAEWALIFTDQFRSQALEQPYAVAITVAHLRSLQQVHSLHKDAWVLVLEDDVEFTSAFKTGLLAACAALSHADIQNIHTKGDFMGNPPAIVYP